MFLAAKRVVWCPANRLHIWCCNKWRATTETKSVVWRRKGSTAFAD